MALDIKVFAPVARATNAIYMYVTEDTWATVRAAGYFNHGQLVGSVKAGDIILVNSTAAAGGGFGILLVTAVNVATKTITTAVATLGAAAAS